MPSSASSPSLTPCQTKALDVLLREGNVFLTGAAGTGKSFLLEAYLSGKAAAEYPVVASTGAAAVIVGGRTFHSFFGLGIMEGGAEVAIAKALRNGRVVHRLQRAVCVIIDEISMIPGTVLKVAETIARRAREVNEPWGGLRIIAVGDFAQLPPISRDQQNKDWAFLHSVWQESNFAPALLSTVMRTQDIDFLQVLNFVREGIVNDRVHAFLQDRTADYSDTSDATRLYPHRAQAERYNLQRLESIEEQLHTFPTAFEGSERYLESAKRSLPIPEQLLLKVGALIMMRKNDASGGYLYVNGSLGHVRSIERDVLHIRLLSGHDIDVVPEKFSTLDGDGKEVMAAWNFPVTLAWATTIHKAQGASLDRVTIDLHQLWEPGQAYVALSRVRSGEGLRVERWSASSIRAEPLVTSFYDGLADAAAKYTPRPLFSPAPSTYQAPAPRQKAPKQADRIARAKTLVEEGRSIEEIAAACSVKPSTVAVYIEKLIARYPELDIAHLIPEIPSIEHVHELFREHGIQALKPIFEALDGGVSYDDLRLLRLGYTAARNRFPIP